MTNGDKSSSPGVHEASERNIYSNFSERCRNSAPVFVAIMVEPEQRARKTTNRGAERQKADNGKTCDLERKTTSTLEFLMRSLYTSSDVQKAKMQV